MSKNYLSGTFSFKTDVGKVRLSNEDRVGIFTNTRGNILLVVCDGMGGQNRGEYAASIALRILKESFEAKRRFYTHFGALQWLRKTIRKANAEVFNIASSKDEYKDMGTTLTCCLILNDDFYVGHVGDSRCYILRNRRLIQITEDQTYVDYLYRMGKITKEEMKTHPKRHVLMNALGVFPACEMDTRPYPYMNETIMLCSDGLFNNVSENDIANILKSDDTTEQKVNELISLANSNGGSDNIAVAIWEAQK